MSSGAPVPVRTLRYPPPPRRPSLRKWWLLIGLSILAGPFVCGVVLFYVGETWFGIGGVDDPEDARMTSIARQLTPVMDAAETYRKTHGKYPSSQDDIAMYLPPNFSVRARMGFLTRDLDWRLSSVNRPEKTSFSLYVKLSWDGGLVYDSSTNLWTFEPGTGAPATPLRLKFR